MEASNAHPSAIYSTWTDFDKYDGSELILNTQGKRSRIVSSSPITSITAWQCFKLLAIGR